MRFDAQYYQPVYLLLITVCTLAYFIVGRDYQDQAKNGTAFCVVMTIFLALFIGFRPVSLKYFVDMAGLAAYFDYWATDHFQFSWEYDNFIYDNLRCWMATMGWSFRPFCVIIAFVYFGGIYYCVSRLFPSQKAICLLVYLAAFSTFSFATNGIKAGSAASLFLVALPLHKNRRPVLAAIFLTLSLGFHHSMVLPIVAYIVCLLLKNRRYFYVIWCVCLLMALLNVTYFQDLFADLCADTGDEQGASYLIGIGSKIKGFRYDFVLYSSVPIIIAFFAERNGYKFSDGYNFILNLYLLTNSLWMLCMYAEFTNRIAYLSWFLYPIVLVYPFIGDGFWIERKRIFRLVTIGHLAFTLFMSFVYYA